MLRVENLAEREGELMKVRIMAFLMSLVVFFGVGCLIAWLVDSPHIFKVGLALTLIFGLCDNWSTDIELAIENKKRF